MLAGTESEVFVGEYEGERVAIKKPRLTCRDDLDRFHSELQLLWYSSSTLSTHHSG